MIDTLPGARWEDIHAFEDQQEGVFKTFDALRDEYVGPYYDGRVQAVGGGGENHIYQWISTMKAQICAGQPRWVFTSDIGSELDDDLQTARLAMNRWSVETNLRRLLQNCFTDWAFLYACCVLTRKPQPHVTFGSDETPALWPEPRRMSPKAHGWDPLATSYQEARVKWHKYIADIEDLSKNAKSAPKGEGWDMKALAGLKPSEEGTESLRGRREHNPSQRKDLVCYDVWVPEERLEGEPGPEEGYNGTWHTYALQAPTSNSGKDQGNLTEIRRPRPAFCHPSGPYIMIGMDYVPDKVKPLSHMLALKAEMTSVQIVERVIDMAMRDYCKGIFVNARDPDLPQIIKDGIHRGVIPIQNFQGKADVYEMEIGGLTQQMAAQYEFRRNMLDRKSGFSDAQRSLVTGDATATENAIASSSSDARTSGYRESYYEFPKAIGTCAYYMMEHDDEALVPVAPQDAFALGVPTGMEKAYTGGDRRISVAVDVEPKSMMRRSEAQEQARALQLHQLIVADATAMLSTPHLDWKARHKKLGIAFDEPDIAEEFNYPLAGAIAGLMLQSELQGATETGSPRDQQPTQATVQKPPAKQLGSAQPAPKQPSVPGKSAGQSARQGAGRQKVGAA